MARTRRGRKPAASAAAAKTEAEAEVENEEMDDSTAADTTTEDDPKATEGEAENDDSKEENENDDSKGENEENGADEAEEMDDHGKLKDAGCPDDVADLVRDLVFNESVMTFDDMSADVVSLLCDFPMDKLDSALKEFVESDFSTIKGDKSTHLRSLLKAWKDDTDEQKTTSEEASKTKTGGGNQAKRHGPDEAKIKELLERTGYKHEVTSKGRVYGPPPDVEDKPTHKQEIFVGKLARDVYEDELVPLFEKHGKLYDIKILIEPNSGFNRGFAFVSYCEKECLYKAAAELNDHEIRPGKKMKVNVSIPNQRLFVGNVPKQKAKEEILEEFKKVSDGLEDVIVYSNPDDETKKNRGFAFLEYSSHTAAANARQKFLRGVKAFGSSHCTGDWADPEEDPDEETMGKVKILHVRNLSSDVTEEQLKKHFSEPLGEDGLSKIAKVKKVKYNAFIDFNEREDAIKVMEAVNDTELGKQKIQVSLAKPTAEKRERENRRSRGGGPRGGGRGRGNAMSPRGGRGAMGGGRGRGGWGGGFGGPQNMSGGGWGGGFSGGGGYGGPPNNSSGWGGGYGGPGWGNGPMHGGGNWGSPNPMRGPGGMGMSRGGGWGGPGPQMRMGGPGGNWGGPGGNWGPGGGGNWNGGRGGWGGGMRGGFGGGGGMRGGFGGRGGGQRGGRGGRGQKRPRGGGQGRSNNDSVAAAKKPRVEKTATAAAADGDAAINNDGPAAEWGNQPIAQQPLPKAE